MRKIRKCFFIVLLIAVSCSFSAGTATLDRVVSTYQIFINDYLSVDSEIPLVRKLKEELNYLAIYKLIRLELAGSVERKESASNISEYLTTFYNKYKPQEIEERLALAGLLSYVVSELSSENLELSTINKLPAFISAFNDYVALVIKDFRNLSKNLIAYSLGLVGEVPKDFEDIEVLTNLEVKGDFSSFVIKKYNYYDDILEIFRKTNLKASILQKADEIRNSGIKDFKDISREINVASNSISRNLRAVLSSYQLELAKKMVSITPKKFDLWWLRFVIYGVLLFFGFRYPQKVLNVIIYTIIGFESFYILLFSNGLLGKFDSIVYSFLILIFVFAMFRFIQLFIQGKLSLLSIVSGFISVFIFILMFFVPIYPNSDGLKISNFNGFENSVYYDLLRRDLYLDRNSDVNRNLSNLYSTVSKEFLELKDQVKKSEKFVNSLYNAGAFSKMSVKNNKFDAKVPSFSDFYSFSNWKNYNSLLSEIAESFKNFERKSKEREKQIAKLKGAILLTTEKYFSVFTKKMRQDFYNFLNDFLGKSNTTKFVINDIKVIGEKFSEKPSQPVKIRVYRTRMGNITIVLGLMLSSLMFLLKKDYYKVASVFLFIATISWLIKINSADIFVDKNIPFLHINNLSNPNFLVPILFLFLAFFSFINKKLLKG